MTKKVELSNGFVVVMRQPKVGDFVGLKGGYVEQEVQLLSKLTGLRKDFIYELTIGDYTKLGSCLESFLNKER